MDSLLKVTCIGISTIILLTSCNKNRGDADLILKNETYTVMPNKVVQGNFTAVAISPTEITTNYKSPSDKDFSPIIEFRFSFNSRDNELKTGQSHFAIVGGTNNDITYEIGKAQSLPTTAAKPLSKNYKWTVKLNMKPILSSFQENGFYITPTNDTIYKEDFKGVWIAGGSEPLTWDFENLYGKEDRKLKPIGNSDIYAATIVLNPATEAPKDPQTWKIAAPNTNYPLYSSKEVLIDALYNMAIDNINSNVRPDSTYRAGAGWDGVWTRDVSYSIYLALGYLDPQGSMRSLKAKVKNDRIIQDTGTGGSWPVSSDRIVWSIAAWEVYKVTGDKEWLKYAFNVIKNSIEDDRATVYDKNFGLMHGEQSYLDWREQSYPRWMQPKDIYESMALGTNVLFARAYDILGKMSKELGVKSNYSLLCKQLVGSINKQLWIADKGYYSEYLYGGIYPVLSPSVDNLGQALSVIWDVASDEQAESLITKTPVTEFGTTSIYPMLKDIKPYHNNAVWPFVQAFWNLAAAKTKNIEAVKNGVGALYRAAALFGTHKELFVASTGDFRGTAVNSDKMLWSSAGNVAMIFRMYFGMDFKTDGIEFKPFTPHYLSGTKKLQNFKYRKSILDIELIGSGTEISSMTIDGKGTNKHFFPGNLSGKHTIVIEMTGDIEDSKPVNMQAVMDMPYTPDVSWTNQFGKIENYLPKYRYTSYLNGEIAKRFTTPNYIMPTANTFMAASIAANDGPYYGYISKPYEYIPIGTMTILNFKDFAPAGSGLIAAKYSPIFVETSTTKNTNISMSVEVKYAGTYFIDVRYSNGNGPINTENKCAIRTLFVNGVEEGPIVMPQRGIGEWVNTGLSNMIQVQLKAGMNNINLRYVTPQNVNMNGEVNTALLQYLRVIQK